MRPFGARLSKAVLWFAASCCLYGCSAGPQPLVPGLAEAGNSLVYVHTMVSGVDCKEERCRQLQDGGAVCEKNCRQLQLVVVQVESIDGHGTGEERLPPLNGEPLLSDFPRDLHVKAGKKRVIVPAGSHDMEVSIFRIS